MGGRAFQRLLLLGSAIREVFGGEGENLLKKEVRRDECDGRGAVNKRTGRLTTSFPSDGLPIINGWKPPSL